MADILEYSNLEQQIKHKNGPLSETRTALTEDQGLVDQMREEMRERYGWLSPYEYYYGNNASDIDPSESKTAVTLDDLDSFDPDSDEETMAKAGPADKENIPNYFWVDSLDNWCYFKITDDMTPFKKVVPRFGQLGNILLNITTSGILSGIEAAQNGRWWDFFVGWTYGLALSYFEMDGVILDTAYKISQYISSKIEDFSSLIYGPSLLSEGCSVIDKYQLTLSSMMLGSSSDLYSRTGKYSIANFLMSWILMSYDLEASDFDAEAYTEMVATGNTSHNMPRNCISLYMWNGYKRTWMPLKNLIEIYDRYCKRSNTNLVYCTVENMYEDLIRDEDVLYTFLRSVGIPVDSEDPDTVEYRERAKEIRTAYSGDRDRFISNFTELIMSIPNCVNYVSRFLFVNTYGIDPACIEAIQKRSPLSKKQVIFNSNGSDNTWSMIHWLENWGCWIPLPNDKSKIKMYYKNTYQLINRPISEKNWMERDLLGYVHKNIGHPCFMRGNDDTLWMAYWLRWTSTRGKQESGGTILNKEVSVGGIQDITTLDTENWDAILSSMFEKHDDYGFDEWLINGNYLLNNHRFTVDEEVPSVVLTAQESTVAPDKTAPVNSVDKSSGSELVLSLSSGTVISRDNLNSLENAAKRWK